MQDALAAQLIQSRRTMILATADPEPWCAPVYYLYRNQKFFFFSSANSRHITAALTSGRCAASIFRDSDDWRDIEGLQMDGCLERIPIGPEAIAVFGSYVQKFPTVHDLFTDAILDFRQFTERLRTQLYAFVPGQVFYLNNRAGLGKRREIHLPT